MEKHTDLREPAEDVRMWIAQNGAIMLKAVTPHGDPVELVAAEARRIAQALTELADRLETG